MLEEILAGILSSIEAISGSAATLGFIGLLLFAVCLFAITRIPRALRDRRSYWFIEIFLFPAVVVTGAAVLTLVLTQVGLSRDVNSPDFVSAVALILTAAYLIDRATNLFIWQGLSRRAGAVVPEIIRTLISAVIYIGGVYVIIAVVYARPVTGLVISSTVMIGILGLALQPVLGDIIAGVSLTIHRPFKVGDWIELEDGAMGKVITTDWRATRILTRHNTVHIIPNGQLSNATIHNYDEPNEAYGFWFQVPVSGTISPKLVVQLLLEAAIKSPSVLDHPAPIARIWDAQEMPVRYLVTVHCREYLAHFNAKSEVLQNAWQLFDRAGFSFAARAMEAELRRGEPAHGSEPQAEEILDEIKLLSPLTRAERQHLVDVGIIRMFAADEAIVVQDDRGDSAFIILAGMVRVHLTNKEEDRGRDIELARLGTYDFFGEMSLLTGAPRSANVTAYTDCKLLEIPNPSMEPILEERPELANELAQLMAERQIRSEMLASGAQQKSMGDILTEYKEAFAQTIRGVFRLGKAQ